MYSGQRGVEKEFPRYLRPISVIAEQVTWKENTRAKSKKVVFLAIVAAVLALIALGVWRLSSGDSELGALLCLCGGGLIFALLYLGLMMSVTPTAVGYGGMALYLRYGKSKVDIWLWTEIRELKVVNTAVRIRSGHHYTTEQRDLLHLHDNNGQDWTFPLDCEPPTEFSEWICEAKRGWRISL